ncbi:YutD family protein [Limosilactobacillus sp.]|uniref:YutD family protein n=1 Tax=Limosilactobacillus sp. TaxID=2773925 RepID=UPI00345E59D6
MNRTKIQDYIDKREEQRADIYHATVEDDTHFAINGHRYELVFNNRDAFDAKAFANRFSMVLAKYDYIVGDLGYGQLRLRGFYANDHPKIAVDRRIATLQDYLYENCNFGCPYFVVHNLAVQKSHNKKRRRPRHRRHHSGAIIRERHDKLTAPPVHERHHQEVKKVRKGRKREFVMRRRKED